jgi:hypothetical protein
MQIPNPLTPPLSITIPGVGEIQGVREFALAAYSACEDARAFIQSLMPVLSALGLPLCILGCVSSVIQIFAPGSVPPLDPSAIPNMIQQCQCLLTFTPAAFCTMLRQILALISAILQCMIGLIGDIILLVAQVAELATHPDAVSKAMGACLAGNAANLQKTINAAWGPVAKMFNSLGFLFSFIGAAPQALGDVTGGPLQALADVAAINTQILDILNLIPC